MRLNVIQRAFQNKHSTFLINLKKQLLKKLDDTIEQEELLCFRSPEISGFALATVTLSFFMLKRLLDASLIRLKAYF